MTVDLADIPDLSFNLDQVPLGVQVVDWPGLAAATIPQVSPAYPNDIYAVLAGLQAWDRTDPVKPQVLQSDGQHALRVRIVNPSSGGIAAITQLSRITGSNPDSTINWDVPDVVVGTTMYDATNPTRLTALATGVYLIHYDIPIGKVGSDPPTNNYNILAGAYLQVNGSNILFDTVTNTFIGFNVTGNTEVLHFPTSGSAVHCTLTTYEALNAGDYVEVLTSLGHSSFLDYGFKAEKFSMAQVA